MSCPRCGNGMWLNGSMWQCDACGYLAPANGVVPQDRSALKAILARAARRNRAALDRLSR